ncbi:hypothetical protein [Paenibacillus phytohabitans]|uniref:hypothetical protein n=1 Tax=Paenibacillus phytohabitans TaxID=2654978 RepID=UPI00300B6059
MKTTDALEAAVVGSATHDQKLKLSEKLALVVGFAPNVFHTQNYFGVFAFLLHGFYETQSRSCCSTLSGGPNYCCYWSTTTGSVY